MKTTATTDRQILAILCLLALAIAIGIQAQHEHAALARKEAKP